MSHLQVIFMDTVQRCKETRLIQGTQTVQLSVLHDCSVMSNSLWPHGLKPARLFCPWNFSDNNSGVGYHFLLQGIFLTQGSNLHLLRLLHWQADSLPLRNLGSPVAIRVDLKFRTRWLKARLRSVPWTVYDKENFLHPDSLIDIWFLHWPRQIQWG